MTPWEAYIEYLVIVGNESECLMVRDSRADNITLSSFIACGSKTLSRDDYVYVVYGEQNPDASTTYEFQPTVDERLNQVKDMTTFTNERFMNQPSLPPTTLSIQV